MQEDEVEADADFDDGTNDAENGDLVEGASANKPFEDGTGASAFEDETNGAKMHVDEANGVAILPGGKGVAAGTRPASSKAIAPADRSTTVYMTKYEKARILGTRALQLSMNAPPMVELHGETDPLQIAMKELRERKIPLIIRRILPDESYEDWSINELIIDI